MAPRFHRLTLAEFADLLDRFPFTRTVNAVHMHHTWRPNHADFRGHDSIVSMWRHHTQVNGWSDIAQHVTIDPEGFIWTGRSWNRAPASAAGQNGNSRFGPFMFEMIGDFDRGRDPFRDPQRATALAVVALVQEKFGLRPETLRFHREMSSKTCPGSAIDYDEVLAEVRRLRDAGVDPGASRSAGAEMPFDADALATHEILREMLAEQPRAADPPDAEPGEEGTTFDPGGPRARPRPEDGRARGSGLSAEQLSALRPHLVNLRQGEFSGSGELTTTPGEVDAIFQEHLPREARAAAARGEPLRIVFWAHG
ncbi:MAG TPA: peptidoglycan recognition family protein, partial [Longimicrobiaceae bacterium]|nr:peptidoglycan recognition family protein [Longimicrobiaceae bacterium]